MTARESTRLAWLRKYTKANPLLALWSLMLFCGGSVLLSYHADLAYLPDFSLVDLAGLMASVTLIGLMLVVFFLFSCFVPGLTLRWVEHQWPLVPYRRYFNFTEMIVLWVSSVGFWAFYLLYADDFLPSVPASIRPYTLLVVVSLASVVGALLASRRTAAKFSLKRWKYRLITRHALAFPIWIGLFIFPIVAALKFANSGAISQEIPLAVFAVVMLTIFNGIVYAAPLNEVRDTIGIDGVIVFVLLAMVLGVAIVFPQTIMQSLALGHRNAATLTVAGKHCHGLARFGVACTADNSKDGTIELENVNVLSRAGATVLLELLVQQTDKVGDTGPRSASAGALQLARERRGLYCPATDKNAAAPCSACDARLLQRAVLPAGATGTLDRYRSELVCVQLAIPKADIVHTAFGAARRYSGHSGFTLPAQQR